MRAARLGACIMLALLTGACASEGWGERRPIPPGEEEMHIILAQLGKGHSDKIKLSMYAGLPFVKKMDPAVKVFTEKMGRDHQELLKELQAYATGSGMPLRFEWGQDVLGQTQRLMEQEQSKALQAAGGANFELLLLVLEFSDYGWQRNLIKATLASGRPLDPALRTYLEKSLRIHDEGSREIEGLLKRFEFR